jgi:hypothetical protein
MTASSMTSTACSCVVQGTAAEMGHGTLSWSIAVQRNDRPCGAMAHVFPMRNMHQTIVRRPWAGTNCVLCSVEPDLNTSSTGIGGYCPAMGRAISYDMRELKGPVSTFGILNPPSWLHIDMQLLTCFAIPMPSCSWHLLPAWAIAHTPL